MKRNFILGMALVIVGILSSCSSTKVLDSWKGEPESIDAFRQKNVFVLARTANTTARIAFEEEIVNELKARGIKATESFKKFPKIHANKEITEERVELIKSILGSEGFNGIVITVIKDKEQSVHTNTSGIYVGAYGGGYPSYYGGFYNYYARPYAYGSYYNSFGGYIPTGTSTSVSTTYVLETAAYNLDEPSENQLVFVVTTSIDDPREAYKAAEKYVAHMVKSLE